MKNPTSPPRSKPTLSTRISQDRMLLIIGGLFASMVCLTLDNWRVLRRPSLNWRACLPRRPPHRPAWSRVLSIGSASFLIEFEPLGPGGVLPAYPTDPAIALLD